MSFKSGANLLSLSLVLAKIPYSRRGSMFTAIDHLRSMPFMQIATNSSRLSWIFFRMLLKPCQPMGPFIYPLLKNCMNITKDWGWKSKIREKGLSPMCSLEFSSHFLPPGSIVELVSDWPFVGILLKLMAERFMRKANSKLGPRFRCGCPVSANPNFRPFKRCVQLFLTPMTMKLFARR